MLAVIATVFIAAAEVAPPEASAANDELRGYLLEAAGNHPALEARYAEWRAALERIPQVTALDDPMFAYTQFLQADMNRARLMLEQRFPWFGTLKTRGHQAAHEADAVLERFYAERNRLFAEVKQAYFDYAFLAEQIEIAQAQVEILEYLEDVMVSRYALGLSLEDELLRIQTERIMLEDQAQRLELLRPAYSARLLQAMGATGGEELPWPQTARLPADTPPADDAVEQALAANPDLRAFDAAAEGRRAEVELARKRRYPDIAVGLEYMAMSKPRRMRPDRPATMPLMAGRELLGMATGAMPFDPVSAAINTTGVVTSTEPMVYSDGGEDEIALTLRVNLPIWRGKLRAGIAEARLREEAVRHEQRREALTIETAVRRVIAEMEDARQRLDTYGGALIPQALRTFESLETSFAVDAGASFLDVFESVRTILEFNLEQAMAVRDLHVAAAQLEWLIGGPWSSGAPLEPPPGITMPQRSRVEEADDVEDEVEEERNGAGDRPGAAEGIESAEQ